MLISIIKTRSLRSEARPTGLLDACARSISADVNASKVGQTFRVIVDREEEDFYVGRTQYDSPEVDPEILISKDTP